MLFGRVTDFGVRTNLRAPPMSRIQNPFLIPEFEELDRLVSVDFIASFPPHFKTSFNVGGFGRIQVFSEPLSFPLRLLLPLLSLPLQVRPSPAVPLTPLSGRIAPTPAFPLVRAPFQYHTFTLRSPATDAPPVYAGSSGRRGVLRQCLGPRAALIAALAPTLA
jgi:hypothetical protein